MILNLLSNAAQATRDGDGTITVRTGMRDAAHVAVEVADNGHGIPADVLPKIFDPFFTTKEVGKGTGLGLSICYKIVENHGGKLEVQSKPGAGTRFTVVLPVKPPVAAAPRDPHDARPHRQVRRSLGELGRGGMAVVYRGLDPVIKRDVGAQGDPQGATSIPPNRRRSWSASSAKRRPPAACTSERRRDLRVRRGRRLRVDRDGAGGGRNRCATICSRAGGRISPALPSVLEQLLEALDYSHARGVVHRDMKPGNVLISDMGVAKISDFGIARVELSHLTQAGEVLGTPYYMAPEQYEGRDIDERTDIYAAGVIVYEVLCGRRPYDGQGGSLLRQILQDPPPPVSTFEPRLPVTIDMVLARALAKKPENRFRNAREFLDALEECVSGSQPSAKTRPGRKCRRLAQGAGGFVGAGGKAARKPALAAPLDPVRRRRRAHRQCAAAPVRRQPTKSRPRPAGAPRWSACGRGASTCW